MWIYVKLQKRKEMDCKQAVDENVEMRSITWRWLWLAKAQGKQSYLSNTFSI